MSAPKFTPGPWEWGEDKIDRGTNRGKPIKRHLRTGKLGQGTVLSASWNEFDGGVWQTWIGVNNANAALIAAAPDLYEALKPFARLLASAEKSGLPDTACILRGSVCMTDEAQAHITIADLRAAFAALSKAEGQQ